VSKIDPPSELKEELAGSRSFANSALEKRRGANHSDCELRYNRLSISQPEAQANETKESSNNLSSNSIGFQLSTSAPCEHDL
jgi:hypothetical protein